MFEAVVAGFCAGSSGVALRLALADETAQTSKFLLLVLFAALTASTWFFHVHAVRVAHGASGGHQRGVGLRLLGRLLHRAEKLHVVRGSRVHSPLHLAHPGATAGGEGGEENVNISEPFSVCMYFTGINVSKVCRGLQVLRTRGLSRLDYFRRIVRSESDKLMRSAFAIF